MKRKYKIYALLFIFGFLILFYFIDKPAFTNLRDTIFQEAKKAITSVEKEIKKNNNKVNSASEIKLSKDLNVLFLDVGQADAILIKSQNEYMLIDAGNNEDGPLLKDFFNDLGIEEFKYVFGTHAHEDHIGGLDDVIKNFKVKNFYMPEEVTSTQTFVEILDALEAKKIKFQTPKAGTRLKLGDSTVEVIYVGDNKEELNDTSIIIKLTYKDTSFLFTGDATSNEEKLFLDKDIQSDVLKVGHHGSRYSSSQSFLNKVNPDYAIITCAKGNDYDFPHNSTLKRLDKVNAKVYRTDNLGTIIVKSDGKNLTFENVKTKLDGV